jgi:hypothetical protein
LCRLCAVVTEGSPTVDVHLRLRHGLAGNFEDDIASLDAMLCGRSIGINRRNGDALVAGPADTARRSEREAESRRSVGDVRDTINSPEEFPELFAFRLPGGFQLLVWIKLCAGPKLLD